MTEIVNATAVEQLRLNIGQELAHSWITVMTIIFPANRFQDLDRTNNSWGSNR
ncbi:MAG: hypothetical protein ABI026_02785 [Gemmatimonadaceae bacterium]